MLKKISFLFVFFVLVSCLKSNTTSNTSIIDNGDGITLPENGDVPNEALTFDTNLFLANFDSAQEDKIREATELIKKVVASKEFKDSVINYTYNGKNEFFDNAGFSNTQIYEKILNGAEILQPTKNNTMDVEVELYYDSTSTIGYTYPNSRRIWMNTKYFNDYTPVEVADNLTHEWMHKLGFDHSLTWSQDRDHSVPYAIGYLMERLAAQYYTP